MDLTTLHPNDTTASVQALVQKTLNLRTQYPSYPLPASICVFPNFTKTVKDARAENVDLHVTATAACFPSSQSFLEVKLREVELAVESGADEIDVVMNLGLFFAGDYDGVKAEIEAVRKVCSGVVLKVILETGILKTEENIRRASMIAMQAGADFIKTSTGKVEVNATPEAARVMCGAIKDYFAETGRKVGFKAAGGISTAEDAVLYYNIVSEILGEEWLCKELFRLGVSRLGNSLMSAIEGREIKYF